MHLGILLKTLKFRDSIDYNNNGFSKLVIHFGKFAIMAFVAFIAILTIFAVLTRFRLIDRISVCLNFQHVDEAEYKLTAFIFVLRSWEIVE